MSENLSILGNRMLNISEIKEIGLQILIDVDNFCDINNIKYFLGYGTLLGAVRHGGFIPWDDDIDIVMPRPDYIKFLKLYIQKGKYKIMTIETDKNYHLPFAKICYLGTMKSEAIDNYKDIRGIEIDVFPLDGLSNDLHTAKKMLKNESFVLRLRNLSTYIDFGNKNVFTAMFKFLFRDYCRKKGNIYWVNKASKLAQKYDYKSSKLVGNIVTLDYFEKQIFEQTVFEDELKISFEGHMFKVPKDYKKILTQLYGNYMELPPVEKQITHHDFVAYYR